MCRTVFGIPFQHALKSPDGAIRVTLGDFRIDHFRQCQDGIGFTRQRLIKGGNGLIIFLL